MIVERGVLRFEGPQAFSIAPPTPSGPAYEKSRERAFTASEPEFYEQLASRRPELVGLLRDFVSRLADIGVEPEFRRSMVLRFMAGPDQTASAGYIDLSGKVWLNDGWNSAARMGRPDLAEAYLAASAAIVGGTVRRYEAEAGKLAPAPAVVGPDGKGVDLGALF